MPHAGDAAQPKVLMIEDDRGIQGFVKPVLESQGMRFRGVLTGQEGVRAAEQWDPDVVLLDMHLPDISGLETLVGIRAHQGEKILPVIFLTSEKALRSKVESLGKGADDYLTKPVSPWSWWPGSVSSTAPSCFRTSSGSRTGA